MKMYYICLFLVCLITPNTIWAQSTLTFDELPANGFATPLAIPNGYGGFSWNNMYVVNTTGFPTSGFVNGTVSPSNVAIGAETSPGSTIISSFNSTSPFILVSGDFTSAHQNGMSIEITGLNGTSTVFDEMFTLNATGFSFLAFPSSAITEANFAVSGGVDPGPTYLGGNPTMVLDNLTVAPVPEPSSAFVFACGLGTVILLHQLKVGRGTPCR